MSNRDLRLDSDPDLFAVDNGVFDSSTGSVVFRAIQPDDVISKTAGWSYDPRMAAAHRQDVDRFMAAVLPDPAERRTFLKFAATLLSGRRHVRRFFLLTDATLETSGSSGKTALLRLLGEFFGRFGEYSSEVKDARAALLGSRLHAIDAVNRNTGVDESALGGGEADAAGIVMTCLFGECPRSIMADRRMLVIPMRTTFVSEPRVPGEVRVESGVCARFKDMRSALADVLVELYDNRDVAFSDDNIPLSMLLTKDSFKVTTK